MGNKRYFGGSTVKGPVRRLKATTFKQLVEHYFNAPVAKKFTRKEFHSYDSETQKIQKDGSFVTAAVFNAPEDGECKRTQENCVAVTLALLDFDSLTEHEKKEGFVDYAQQFYEAPEFIRQTLYPFNFVFYETISSKPGSRRVRILVDLEEMDVSMHRPAVLMVADLLGISVDKWKGRTESLTLPLPMFRPVHFQDEQYAAILCDRTDGKEIEELDIPEPDNGIDEDMWEFGYSGTAFEDDDLMHLPVPGITIENCREILKHLDADNNYWDWIKVGMALRHQFRQEEEAREAFELFDEWSQNGKSGKYVDRAETYKKWKNFRPDPERRRPTTIRTVFEKAKEAGWDHAPMAKQVKRDVASWIKNQVDPDELMLNGPGRIAAMPFRDDLTEEALMVALQSRIKELSPSGKVSIALATIKKTVRQARRQKKAEENTETPPWVRPWVYITTRNVMRNVSTGMELSPEGFNRTYSVELMSDAPDSDSLATGRPTIAPMDYVLNLLKSKRVDGTIYDPRHDGEEPFFEHEGRMYLNEYRICTVPRLNPAKSKAAGERFKEALLALVGEPHFRLMMDFFAHIVQRPGVLIRWVPLIQSGQGSGKNMLAKCVGCAIGTDNYKPINAKQVTKDFNDWIYGAQFILLDELKLTGKSRAELANSLKDMITNDEISVEKKHQDVKIVENVASKIATTQWQDAVYLEDSDRRWYPIKSPLQTKQQIRELTDTGHFKKLARLYKNGGALRHFLLNWEISPDFPTDGPAPANTFRDEMVVESKNGMQEEIEEMLQDESVPTVASDIIFFPHMVARLTDLKNNAKPSHYLRHMQFKPFGGSDKKFSLGGKRGTIWVHEEYEGEDPLTTLIERNEQEIDLE